jgi:Amt family ammonium transporter
MFYTFLPLLSFFLFNHSALANDLALAQTAGPISNADTAWLLTSSAFVLLMTPGLSFFYGGMVRPKNVVSTMLQSYICMGVVSLLWYFFGFSLVFGESLGGIIGNPLTFAMFQNVTEAAHPVFSPTIPFVLFALFQLKFAIIAPALITGSFAERVNFKSYVLFVILFEIFIYSPLAHMTWHPDGILRQMGVLDFAGGTVVHMSAGLAALMGAFFLGPRSRPGQAEGKESKNELAHAPANIPYVLLGTGLLWFGWFGFNAGSSLAANGLSALAFATTHFASAAAMIAWLALDSFQGKKPSAIGACVGAVVGLVTITPAAGFVSIGSSVLIGLIGATVCYFATKWRSRTQLDDTLDVFPCHGVGGMVGMVLTGVFAKEVGLIAGKTEVFFAHLISLGAVTAGVVILSVILYWIVDQVTPLRVGPEAELLGLDLSQHDEVALSLEEIMVTNPASSLPS